MPQLEPTRSQNVGQAPLVEATSNDAALVTRAVTLCRCLRCDFEWMPRVAKPMTCARCRSVLWNVSRAHKLPGKPEPTRKGKCRGRAFASGFDARRAPGLPPDQGENTNG